MTFSVVLIEVWLAKILFRNLISIKSYRRKTFGLTRPPPPPGSGKVDGKILIGMQGQMSNGRDSMTMIITKDHLIMLDSRKHIEAF